MAKKSRKILLKKAVPGTKKKSLVAKVLAIVIPKKLRRKLAKQSIKFKLLLKKLRKSLKAHIRKEIKKIIIKNIRKRRALKFLKKHDSREMKVLRALATEWFSAQRDRIKARLITYLATRNLSSFDPKIAENLERLYERANSQLQEIKRLTDERLEKIVKELPNTNQRQIENYLLNVRESNLEIKVQLRMPESIANSIAEQLMKEKVISANSIENQRITEAMRIDRMQKEQNAATQAKENMMQEMLQREQALNTNQAKENMMQERLQREQALERKNTLDELRREVVQSERQTEAQPGIELFQPKEIPIKASQTDPALIIGANLVNALKKEQILTSKKENVPMVTPTPRQENNLDEAKKALKENTNIPNKEPKEANIKAQEKPKQHPVKPVMPSEKQVNINISNKEPKEAQEKPKQQPTKPIITSEKQVENLIKGLKAAAKNIPDSNTAKHYQALKVPAGIKI